MGKLFPLTLWLIWEQLFKKQIGINIIGYSKALIENWKKYPIWFRNKFFTCGILLAIAFNKKESGSTWLVLYGHMVGICFVSTTSTPCTSFEYLAFACSHREFLPTNTSQRHLGSYMTHSIYLPHWSNGHCRRVIISRMNWTRRQPSL